MGECGARSSRLLLPQELKCCFPIGADKEALGVSQYRASHSPCTNWKKEVDTRKKVQSN